MLHISSDSCIYLLFNLSLLSGCINRFVEVEYDRMTSSITCRFLDETDTSIKSCSVTYGQCSQVPGQVGQLGNSSTMETPNVVYIKIPVSGDDLKCYNVTASSDVFTVIVQAMGSNTKRGNCYHRVGRFYK